MSEEKKIIPKCKGGEQSYFSAEGRWLPCCSFPHQGPILEKSIFSRPEFLIKNATNLKFWETDIFELWLENTENDYDSAYEICQFRCSSKAHETEKNIKEMTWVMEESHYLKKEFDIFQFLEKHDIDYEW